LIKGRGKLPDSAGKLGEESDEYYLPSLGWGGEKKRSEVRSKKIGPEGKMENIEVTQAGGESVPRSGKAFDEFASGRGRIGERERVIYGGGTRPKPRCSGS